MTDEEAERLLIELSEFYGEPVMPVHRYCDALKVWASRIYDLNVSGTEPGRRRWEQGHGYYMHLNDIIRDITKSNLLYRLIYDRQELRTRRCPTHQGRWSGCTPDPCPDGCSDGSNVTGWLPEE